MVCHRQWSSWQHRFLCCGTGAAQCACSVRPTVPTPTKRSLTARACQIFRTVGTPRTPDRPIQAVCARVLRWQLYRRCGLSAPATAAWYPSRKPPSYPSRPAKPPHHIAWHQRGTCQRSSERTTVRIEAPRRLRIAPETCRTRPSHTTRGRTHYNSQPAPSHVPALTSACGRVVLKRFRYSVGDGSTREGITRMRVLRCRSAGSAFAAGTCLVPAQS